MSAVSTTIYPYNAYIGNRRAAHYSTTPESLKKVDSPPSLLSMGLQPISQYRYLDKGVAWYIAEYAPTDGRDFAIKVFERAKRNIEELAGRQDVYFLRDNNPFVAVVKPDGQVFWKAIDASNGREAREVGEFVLSKGLSLHINTGTHGDLHGNIMADKYRLNDCRHTSQDLHSFYTPGGMTIREMIAQQEKLCIHDLSGQTPTPEYPSKANHIIDAWCFSIQTYDVSFEQYGKFLDENGEWFPPHLKDVLTLELVEDPVYFPECKHIGLKPHFYSRSSVEKLILQKTAEQDEQHPNILAGGWDIGLHKTKSPGEAAIEKLREKSPQIRGRCMLDGCNAKIPNLSNPIDEGDDIEIARREVVAFKEFRLRWAAQKAQTQAEIQLLRGEVTQKDGRITVLEGEKHQKDQKIHSLQAENTLKDRQITVVTAERDEALEKVQDITDEREKVKDLVQAQRIEIDVLRHNQTLEEFILTANYVKTRGIRDLEHLFARHKDVSEQVLKEILRGKEWGDFARLDAPVTIPRLFTTTDEMLVARPRFRRNGFIRDLGSDPLDEVATRRTVEVALEHYQDDIQKEVKVHFSFLVEMPGEFLTTRQIEERESFIDHVMNRLVKADRVPKLLIDKLNEYKVALEIKEPTEWHLVKEPNRVGALTYSSTILNILSECLKHEVSNSMLTAFRAR